MAKILSGSQRKRPMAGVEDSGETSEPQTRLGGKIQGGLYQLSALADHQNTGPLRSHAAGGAWSPMDIYRGV